MTAKDLKNALLQEAVQGKLVPQISSEGNARDLLEEIRKEKSKLVKEGKIKKEKPFEEIKEDEISFDIPANWCWCRLGDAIDVRDGTHDTPAYIQRGYPLITSKDFRGDHFDLSKTKYISKQDYDLINQRSKVEIGDILFSMIGGNIGNKILITTENYFEMAIKNVALFKNNTNVYNLYLFYVLEYYTKEFQNYSVGGAQTFVSLNFIRNYPFPLPPLAEQKRIVSALEKFMPLIEEYGKKETELKALNEQIGTLTKKAILQEAVQGKLVPQIATEGNAKDLLEEIKKEKAKLIKDGKIKKEKPLPEITDDEIPFDIPENWCWCRFSEIFQIINGDRGKNYPAKSTLSKKGIPFISALNLKNNTVEKDDQLLCVSESQYNKLGSGKLEKGDMVVCIRGSLGKHGFFPFEKGAIASSLVIVRQFNNSEILYKFLNIYLDSSLFNQEIKNYDNGTAQPNLAAESFKQFLFPLPPLAEQKRIVVAIEKMLSLCEKLGE